MDSDITTLAGKMIRHIQNRLFLQYRFLEPALYRLNLEETDKIPDIFGTDGSILRYDPLSWLKRFKEDSRLEIRRYLHTIFHCIFLHPFFPPKTDHSLWELACDIVTEAAIIEQLNAFTLPNDQQKLDIINKIKPNVPLLTAQETYTYLQKTPIYKHGMAQLFKLDSHLWMPEEKKRIDQILNPQTPVSPVVPTDLKSLDMTSLNGIDVTSLSPDELQELLENAIDVDAITVSNDGTTDQENGTDGQAGAMIEANLLGNTSTPSGSMDGWKEAGRMLMVDMQAFQQGRIPGQIEATLDYLTRDKMDYTEFLEQFAVMEETMSLDPDDFDYMYYTYGLRLPGQKKLLIEPLEYREVKQIREFVIAIDTSGSCYHTLVKKFLNKTYNILKATEMFTSQVHIRIIQCDAAIQDDMEIHSLDEIEEYISHFKIRGCGGTDFRPVFEYVEKLRKTGELRNLCGLIYFTDGYGPFPTKPTEYKTAFVFTDKYSNLNVPAWALKICWTEED
ncbi:MAG: hypothetical protein IKY83_00905 [Proteobacteria bacterium]|nr:hypothetical protein [Pseudomonadota bacterium]